MKIIILVFITFISSICNGQVKYDYFSKSALEKDLSFFHEKLTSIHPKFLDKSFGRNWEVQFESAKGLLKDSMTQNEFYLLVSPLLASLNDGHSNFSCVFEQRKKLMASGGLSFPFFVKIIGNSIFVSGYFGVDRALFKGGEEILQINNINSSKILNEIRKLYGGNAISMQNKAIEEYFRIYIWICFGFEKDYELIIKNGSDQTTKVIVKGATREQFDQYRQKHPSPYQPNFSLSSDEDKKVSLLTFKSFVDLQGLCHFTDSAFRIIAENKNEYLIIDIRGNGGGQSIVVDSLMNYLTDKQYTQFYKIETRVSNELKAYWKNKYPEQFEDIKDNKIDELLTHLDNKVTPHNKKYRYKGNLFLLTDNITFSSAASFAGVFKEQKLGTIIGEETGGTIGAYGNYLISYLPNSGLEFWVSPKRFILVGGKDLERGVMPDYLISNKNDSIMGFTYKLIAKLHVKA
jgi:hypothetical protein